VILSEPIDADGISQAAETLRRRLARPLTLSDGQIVELAFSVGCARFGPDAALANALSAADTALYADKRAR
jgi:GGDEF domain-containing protein